MGDLMENKRERVMKPMDENAKTSRERVAEGGSSYCNLEKLIEDIKAMNLVGKASSGGEAIEDIKLKDLVGDASNGNGGIEEIKVLKDLVTNATNGCNGEIEDIKASKMEVLGRWGDDSLL